MQHPHGRARRGRPVLSVLAAAVALLLSAGSALAQDQPPATEAPAPAGASPPDDEAAPARDPLPDWMPERRKDQFLTEPAYLIVPFPYSLPGIGSGVAFTGLLANVAETNTDAVGLFITGDVEGDFFSLEDVHVVPETLILEFSRFRANKAVVNSYDKRGMDTDKNDFNLIELSEVDSRRATATLSLLDRRVELFGGINFQTVKIDKVRDADGKLIADLSDNPIKTEQERRFFGAVVDLTDDRQDPRRGFRLEVERRRTAPETSFDPDFFVVDVALSGYVPVGNLSTLLLHHFRSDAHVLRTGETDRAKIRDDRDFGCDPGDAECLEAEASTVEDTRAGNKYGTATGLGDDSRLRSYPQGRYQGAHTRFYAVEFRWNLTEEVTPFDYFVWKDVRTGVQVAFFAETGTVADRESDLGEIYRSSYGLGLRLISASGFVYRADYATGDEGGNAVVIFSYPF